MSKTKREDQLQREIEARLRRANTNQTIEITKTISTSSGGGGIPEAPIDGSLYGRKDAGWEIIPAAVTLTQEEVEDIVGALLQDSTDLDVTYDDALNQLTAIIKNGVVTEAKMNLSDNTTFDVSTTQHGFVPKAPNDINQVLRGDGTWGTIVVAAILIKQLAMASIGLQTIGSISGTFILNLPLP